MIDLATLPIFPCDASDKSPLTEHGFYNARVGADHSRWPLVGVRTGAASGIDVLDVDPGALEWLATNEDRLPVTRRHRTRRGGVHLLFQHAPGLKKSESKIAKDVDVRADGSYAIWWPRQGLPVIDAPLAAWPDWLLPLAMFGRDRVSVRVRGDGDGPSSPWVSMPVGVGPNADVARSLNPPKRIKAIMRTLEGAPKGTRNKTLFNAACTLAEIVAEGHLAIGVAAHLLEAGCKLNGLWRDDGAGQCRATIASAFHTVERKLIAIDNDTPQRGTSEHGDDGLSTSTCTGAVMTSKMKDDPDWFKKPLMSRIAAILYPAHADEETKKQMQSIADAQRKRSPMQRFEKKGR